MKIFVYILLVIFSSCNSVSQTKQSYYKELYVSNKVFLSETTSFIKENFNALNASDCTVEKGGVIISQKSVEDNCYASLKTRLKFILDVKLCYSIEVYNKDQILFVLDFLSDDYTKTEVTYYYLYCKVDTLPTIYEKWKGDKVKLNKNWWYIERVEPQY